MICIFDPWKCQKNVRHLCVALNDNQKCRNQDVFLFGRVVQSKFWDNAILGIFRTTKIKKTKEAKSCKKNLFESHLLSCFLWLTLLSHPDNMFFLSWWYGLLSSSCSDGSHSISAIAATHDIHTLPTKRWTSWPSLKVFSWFHPLATVQWRLGRRVIPPAFGRSKPWPVNTL